MLDEQELKLLGLTERVQAHALQRIPAPYVVIDTEVTMHMLPNDEWTSAPYARTPTGTPTVFLTGYAAYGTTRVEIVKGPPPARACDGEMIVGHNIGFDFGHLKAHCDWSDNLVWDTMIADYILSGQKNKFTSLSELTTRELGRPGKDDLIGDNLKLGVPPQDIPIALMEAYLEGDVVNTRDIFIKQWERASVAQRRLVIVQSRASLVYALCQLNGLRLDVEEAVRRRDKCHAKVERMATGFMNVWENGSHVAGDLEIITAKAGPKWATSPTAMSSLFFGNPLVLEIGNVPDPVKGKRRVRAASVTRPSIGPVSHGVTSPLSGGKNRINSTSDEILQKIIEAGTEPYVSLARMEQERRGAHKLGTTYYQALLEQNELYGAIHPKIHSTSTNTGRTSASDPNIQNQPPETREVFIANDGDVFYEFDFQQLEVCALAEVSRCPLLRDALIAGQDIHYLTGISAGLWTNLSEMTKERRTLVKRVNFGLIYGGGAKTLAKQSGVDVKLVQKIIDSFYKTFPGVASYHKVLMEYVNGECANPGTALPFFTGRSRGVVMGESGTIGEVSVTTKTGRSYVFPEEPAPEFMRARGTSHSISPTKVKNYPIQGFGTADIVPTVLSNLFAILPHHTWRAVVHDSALLNVPVGTDADEYVAMATREALTQLHRWWDITMTVPLRTSSEFKDRWSPKADE